MKVLILGKGFIGSKLGAFLHQKNVDIFHIAQQEIDYTRPRALTTLLKDYNFSHVINCCGYTGAPNVDGCENNKSECWKYNVVISNQIDKLVNDYNKKIIHVSSGCIYTGYEKDFTEADEPNFGIFNPHSSFYSKTKHAFETLIDKTRSTVLRIRMPVTAIKENKNYLYKLYKYDNLISFKNSITCIDDLNNLILSLINNHIPGIFNAVNTLPITAQEIVEIFKKYNKINPNWKFIDISDLNVIANRSNCVLDTSKLKEYGLEFSNTLETVEKYIKEL